MTEFEEFINEHFDVIAPSHRGAAQPEFDPAGINESEFDDGRRAKEVSWVWKDGVFYINWVSQEYGETERLYKEVQRWKNYIVEKAQDVVTLDAEEEWDFPLVFTLSCRDDEDESDALVFDINL